MPQVLGVTVSQAVDSSSGTIPTPQRRQQGRGWFAVYQDYLTIA